jgi:hypothetical protein
VSKRLDVLVNRPNPKDPNGKGFWTKVGAAFENERTGGWKVVLDALPMDGVLFLMPPREPRAELGPARREPADDGGEQPWGNQF